MLLVKKVSLEPCTHYQRGSSIKAVVQVVLSHEGQMCWLMCEVGGRLVQLDRVIRSQMVGALLTE